MSGAATGMFPLFASRFLKSDEEVPPSAVGSPSPPAPAATPRRAPPAAKPSTLRVLDLQTLPRDDGPPTELRTRAAKLAHYEVQCSHVGGRLYVGGEAVARSLDTLRRSSITHVVNCVGFLYPPYFEGQLSYQTLYLQDTPGEDILSVLYDVFDFIEAAGNDSRVFIHCSQGVSRSTTLAIAYRMWAEDRGYEDVFAEVKQMRGVANPNIGFICQLLQWHKRRVGEEKGAPRLFRMTPQSPSAPLYLVPKPAALALDPRGAFVLHDGDRAVYVWTGAACPEAFAAAATRFASQLHRYEGAPAPAVRVAQGNESSEFWVAMEGVGRAAARGAVTPPPGPPPSAAGAREPRPLPAYDRDFDLYARALSPASGAGPDSPLNSARSARKTPRFEPPNLASPNDRLRKQARSEAAEREFERSARSSGSGSAYALGTESARARALDFTELAVRRQVPSPSALGSARGSGGSLPMMTPRGGPSAAEAAAVAAAAGPAVPKLALGGLGGLRAGVPGGVVPAAAPAAPSSASGSDSESGSSSSDSEEDEMSSSDTEGSDMTDSDSDGESGEPSPREGSGGGGGGGDAGPAAPRPAGVPRLNLGK